MPRSLTAAAFEPRSAIAGTDNFTEVSRQKLNSYCSGGGWSCRRHDALFFGQLGLAQRGRTQHTAHAHGLHCRARHQHQGAFFLQPFVKHVHGPQMQRRRILLIAWRLLEEMGDLPLGFAQDDPRPLFPVGLGFTRHRVLQGVGDYHVAHFHRLHRDSPGIGALIDELLQFPSIRSLPRNRSVSEVRPMMSRNAVCAAQLTGLHVVLNFQRRLLGIVDHPEQHRIDVHGNGVGSQRLLGGEAGGDRPLIDPCRDGVDQRHDPEQPRTRWPRYFPRRSTTPRSHCLAIFGDCAASTPRITAAMAPAGW